MLSCHMTCISAYNELETKLILSHLENTRVIFMNYILDLSKMSSRGTEKTMLNQEHPAIYIIYKMEKRRMPEEEIQHYHCHIQK